MLIHNKFKTELEVIYSRKDVTVIVGGLNMLPWLSKNGSIETFK